jgi:myo-inositol-1(or 4)-monophosphatase
MIGSIAYKVALVAKGEIDVAISFFQKNDWDLAAADLIIKEAGGNLKDINGNEICYNKSTTKINSVLACNSFIINNLTNLFNK